MSSRVEVLVLKTLEKGAVFDLKAKEDPDRFGRHSDQEYSYRFLVIEPAEMPICQITETNQVGVVRSAIAQVEGSGIWTTPSENPTQMGDPLFGKPHQDIALSIGYGRLSVGSFLVINNPKESGKRLVFNVRCQEINLG